MPVMGAFRLFQTINLITKDFQLKASVNLRFWGIVEQSATSRIRIKQVRSREDNFRQSTVMSSDLSSFADLDPRIYEYMRHHGELVRGHLERSSTLHGIVGRHMMQRIPGLFSGSCVYSSDAADIDMNVSYEDWYEYQQDEVDSEFGGKLMMIKKYYEDMLDTIYCASIMCEMYVSDKCRVYGDPDSTSDAEREVRQVFLFARAAHPDEEIEENTLFSFDPEPFIDRLPLWLLKNGYGYVRVGQVCIAPYEFYEETVNIWHRIWSDQSVICALLNYWRKRLVISPKAKDILKKEIYRIVYEGTVQGQRFGDRQYCFDPSC
jgi:hypothetical protein